MVSSVETLIPVTTPPVLRTELWEEQAGNTQRLLESGGRVGYLCFDPLCVSSGVKATGLVTSGKGCPALCALAPGLCPVSHCSKLGSVTDSFSWACVSTGRAPPRPCQFLRSHQPQEEALCDWGRAQWKTGHGQDSVLRPFNQQVEFKVAHASGG